MQSSTRSKIDGREQMAVFKHEFNKKATDMETLQCLTNSQPDNQKSFEVPIDELDEHGQLTREGKCNVKYDPKGSPRKTVKWYNDQSKGKQI